MTLVKQILLPWITTKTCGWQAEPAFRLAFAFQRVDSPQDPLQALNEPVDDLLDAEYKKFLNLSLISVLLPTANTDLSAGRQERTQIRTF